MTKSRIVEKVEKSNREELLRLIPRGGPLGIETTKELLKRGNLSGKDLGYILQNLKPTMRYHTYIEKVMEIKNQVTLIIESGFLDEQNFSIILDEITLQNLLQKAVGQYRSSTHHIPNYILKKVVERVPRFRQWATRTILKQNPTTDELLAVLDGLEETKLQLQLQKEVLAELFKMGLPLDDAVSLIQLKEAVIAEMVWDHLHHKNQIKELPVDELEDICNLTDSPKVKKEVEKELELREKKNIVIPYL